jgi:predicted transcriptional regulator
MLQTIFPERRVSPDPELPSAVIKLCPRMREIATVVYLTGGATVREIQAGIEDPPTLCGIRTLLNRLVLKGILRRRRSGRHTEVFYLPAVLTPELEQVVLSRFVEHHFEGSVASALQTISRLV